MISVSIPPLAWSDTPIGALMDLHIEAYDLFIGEFKAKSAARAAAKAEEERRAKETAAKALQAGQELRAKLLEFHAVFPALEAAGLVKEFGKLEIAETAIADGFVPNNIGELAKDFSRFLEKSEEMQRVALDGLKKSVPIIQKLDVKLGIELRRLFDGLVHVCRRLISHYRQMVDRAKRISERAAAASLTGSVRRAYELYIEACTEIEGVQISGEPISDFRDNPPVYELPVTIDPSILTDRHRLHQLERAIDDYVERRDPMSVGLIVLRIEPLVGAA